MDGTITNSDRYALRQWEHDSLKQKAKGVLGSLLMLLFPRRAKAVLEDDFTHSGRRASLLSRLIGAGIAYRELHRRDFGRLAAHHKRYWGGARAKAYHDDAPGRFESVFVRYHMPLIDRLEEFLKDHPQTKTLCEIGSGAGLVADHLAERFDFLDRYIGVDLDPVTVAAARETYSHPKLEFVAGDAVEYVETHAEPNWVYFTQNGVLEYFEPEAVERLLRVVSSRQPATMALIEPVGLNHDLEAQPESWPYGQEFSFSHNYPHLLEKHGFELLFRQEVMVCGYRYMLMLATSGEATS
jgi:hypothetical protein